MFRYDKKKKKIQLFPAAGSVNYLLSTKPAAPIHRKSNDSGRRWSSRSDGIQAGHILYSYKKKKGFVKLSLKNS